MKFTHTTKDESAALSVFFSDGTSRTLTTSHPNFDRTVLYLSRNTDHDEDEVRDLVDPARFIGRVMAEVTDRVTYDDGHLFLDGIPFEGLLADEIRRRLESPTAGDASEWQRLMRFALNVDANPSRNAQQAVYQWVQKQGLTLTEDGCFIGYKAVLPNMMSSHSGPANYVNGRLYKQGAHTQVPHEIGTVVSKKRGDVDDRPGGGCSVGLHVGSKAYATGFLSNGVLVTVKVNPADVVSAPNDYSLESKIRVCKYEVVSFLDERQFARTSWDPQDRESRMRDLEGLTEGQREVYDRLRKDDNLLHADALREARDFREPEPEVEETADLVRPEKGTGLLGRVVLRDWAEVNPGLKRDLADSSIGHKPLAAKYSDITTEASVRRYRKSLEA